MMSIPLSQSGIHIVVAQNLPLYMNKNKALQDTLILLLQSQRIHKDAINVLLDC